MRNLKNETEAKNNETDKKWKKQNIVKMIGWMKEGDAENDRQVECVKEWKRDNKEGTKEWKMNKQKKNERKKRKIMGINE